MSVGVPKDSLSGVGFSRLYGLVGVGGGKGFWGDDVECFALANARDFATKALCRIGDSAIAIFRMAGKPV